jgi:hypothetical protein
MITTLRYAIKQDMTIAHAVNSRGMSEGIDRKLQRIAAELVPETQAKPPEPRPLTAKEAEEDRSKHSGDPFHTGLTD